MSLIDRLLSHRNNPDERPAGGAPQESSKPATQPPPAALSAPLSPPSDNAHAPDYDEMLQEIRAIRGAIGEDTDRSEASEESVIVPLTLGEILELLPPDCVRGEARGEAQGSETVGVRVRNPYEQLARGKVLIDVADLIVDVPDSLLTGRVDDHFSDSVSLPLPKVVMAISPQELADRTAKRERDPSIHAMPNLFDGGSSSPATSAAKAPARATTEAQPPPETVAPQRAEAAGPSEPLPPEDAEHIEPAVPIETGAGETPPASSEGHALSAPAEVSPEPIDEPPRTEGVEEAGELLEAGGTETDEVEREQVRVPEPEARLPEAEVGKAAETTEGMEAAIETEGRVEPEEEPAPEHAEQEAPIPPASKARPWPALMVGETDINNVGVGGLVAAFEGLGAVVAERIVAGRPYRRRFDLRKVKGVGPALYFQMTGEQLPSRSLDFDAIDSILAGENERGISFDNVAKRIADLPGVGGCIMSHSDGYPLATAWSRGKGQSIAAIAPQLYKHVAKYFDLLQMPGPDSLVIQVHPRPVFITRKGDVFMIVFLQRSKVTARRIEFLEFLASELVVRWKQRRQDG